MDNSHTSSTEQQQQSLQSAKAPRWAPKISVTNLMSAQMWNMVTNSSSVPKKLMLMMARKAFLHAYMSITGVTTKFLKENHKNNTNLFIQSQSSEHLSFFFWHSGWWLGKSLINWHISINVPEGRALKKLPSLYSKLISRILKLVTWQLLTAKTNTVVFSGAE